jgi:hypothetical protein
MIWITLSIYENLIGISEQCPVQLALLRRLQQLSHNKSLVATDADLSTYNDLFIEKWMVLIFIILFNKLQ